MNEKAMIPTSGAIVRQDNFGGAQVATVQDTAASMVAAQAKAAIEARWIVAMKTPRNLDQVRGEMLKECARPSFANAAMYLKPIGDGIEGLSIRFVEAAMQLLGNMDSESITIYDDKEKRIVQITVTDFERNVSHKKQITISKTVERRYLRRGQIAVGQRTNSYGDTVYIVEATDDDLLNKEAALVSKAVRTCGLRLVPGWLQDEATEAIKATALDKAAEDPDAERRKLADAFAKYNVMPNDLEEYLGHDLAKVTPAELDELRQTYNAIRGGDTAWQDVIEHRRDTRGDEAPPEPKERTNARGTAAVKQKIEAKKKAKEKAAAPREPVKSQPPSTSKEAKTPDRATIVITEAKGTVAVESPLTGEPDKAAPAAQPEEETKARPSKSKAAQKQRRDDVEGLPVINDKFAGLYINYGDPRNFAKGYGDPPLNTPIQQEPKIPTEEEIAETFTESEQEPPHDPVTGETEPDEEPEWMRGAPPTEEQFG